MPCASPETCIGRDGERHCERCCWEVFLEELELDRHEVRAERLVGNTEYASGDRREARRQVRADDARMERYRTI